ncbi:MAG: primosomal protein N' [Chloroflexota bacterium]|nr:primosomal protein N' [Chloroflexota bacterium]
MLGKVEPGHLVVVQLRGRPSHGVVVELTQSSPVEETQPIIRLADSGPILPPAMIELAHWIASYYRCTLWQAMSPMLPPGVARRAVTTVGLTALPSSSQPGTAGPLLQALGRRQKQVVSMLAEAPRGTLTVGKLRRDYTGSRSGLDATLGDLERKGLVTRHTELPAARAKPQFERIIRLLAAQEEVSDAIRDSSQRAPLQAAALDWLLKRARLSEKAGKIAPSQDDEGISTDNHEKEGWQPLSQIYLHTGANSSTLVALERKGLVELSQRPIYRKPVPPTAATLNEEPPPLTAAQAAAWREISAALRATVDSSNGPGDAPSQRNNTFLLHGVTGSGKTEIYLRAIGGVLRAGKQAIVLVPEISLTPQAVHRYSARFPGRVALIHSQLSAGQQFDEWRRIREGRADIVVGSRSAIFAPMPRLGLIVVDEEHEWAYKQDRAPMYHARDVALKRASLTGAVTILGSATPDLATYYHAQKGDYKLLSLPNRVGRRRTRGGSELSSDIPMPTVQVVDMRAELRGGNESLFSRSLQSAIEGTLARKEQVILYLNRRGSNSFILCRECGYVPECPRCDVPLVYHADVYGMLCHRCNAYSLLPRECPRCGSSHIRGYGTGTQKVVDEVEALFPRARVLRWDRDTASRQGGHADMMEMFTKGEADILVGTQMIAKGLDIARVTLVGVISADTGLFLPDFRAPERTVQLLMQVAGRAGRRAETTHSRVVVQSFNPEHYAIQAAAQYDYKGFYDGEIRFRAEHGYPPYGQLARLVVQSTYSDRAETEAQAVARHLRNRAEEMASVESAPPVDVLGPAPCFVHKVRGRYRWQVLLRGHALDPLLHGFRPATGSSLDIDPMNLL